MSLKETIAAVNKQFGKGSLMLLGESPQDIPVISTGSLALDVVLGGGYPRGRIVEIYGPEASGKTTLALTAIAEAQRQGLKCAIIDVEHALDPSWARQLGVQVDDLLLAQPTTGEEALSIVDMLVRSGELGLIVVDSVAALTPKAELAGEIGDSHMGLLARLMSQSMRMLTAQIQSSQTTVIFLNQIRMKIGVFFGNPEETPGGKALRFHASQRIDVRRKATLREDDVATGNTIKMKVVKNKIAPPFRVTETNLMFDSGIDKVAECIELGVKHGVIAQKGAWFTYAGERFQGKPALRAHIADNVGWERVYEEIKDKLRG